MNKFFSGLFLVLLVLSAQLNCAGLNVKPEIDKVCVNVKLESFPFWYIDTVFKLKGQDPNQTDVEFSSSAAYLSRKAATKALFILFNLEGMTSVYPDTNFKELTRGYTVIMTGMPQERIKVVYANKAGQEVSVRLEAPGKYRLCNVPYGISPYTETAQRNYSYQEMNQLLN
jgi:hypothetical protein